MTLRLRLLLLLVGIVAIGLVVSDVVTYTSLRSFLTDRLDQQLQGAAFPVERALLSSAGWEPQVPFAPGPAGSSGASGASPTVPGESRPPSRSGALNGGQRDERGLLVPPGTYGQLRDSSGDVVTHVFFAYGGKAPAEPAIPTTLPTSAHAGPDGAFFSTSSGGNGSVGYRAVAQPLRQGDGTVVVAVPLTELNSTLHRLLVIEGIVTVVVLGALGFLSWVMIRRDLRPLDEMAKATKAIAAGDLSQRVPNVEPGTEVGTLGTAFNTMVEEIEGAFAARAASEERLRRFLADASHELRTPLTSILGYAEIFELGVRHRPADLATSMRNIRGEAARMSTLVEDLFLLAQLDHERPLAREPLDLAAVASSVVANTRAGRPDRLVELRAEAAPMVGDPHRLQQVVANLVANAVEHTTSPAGVEVTVARVDGQAVLSVHDDGPGIAPEDLPRIFEPFYRSDASRSRTTGGAGLGLAIASAIVTAHGGVIDVTCGEGTTFVVRMPAARSEPAAAGPA